MSESAQIKNWQVNIAILLLAALVVISSFQALRDDQSALQWEYKIASAPDAAFTDEVNRLGADGWEIIFARRASSGEGKSEFNYEMIFRRHLRQSRSDSILPLKGINE